MDREPSNCAPRFPRDSKLCRNGGQLESHRRALGLTAEGLETVPPSAQFDIHGGVHPQKPFPYFRGSARRRRFANSPTRAARMTLSTPGVEAVPRRGP